MSPQRRATIGLGALISQLPLLVHRGHVSVQLTIAVENVRVDGKPTRRHIAYLGGITESAIRIVHRDYFWQKTDEELKRLGYRIGKTHPHRIEEALARNVPRPGKAEAEQVKRDWAKLGVPVA